MRITSVVGNRPQFVKAAPLSRALRAVADETLVHTGQHYDPALSDLFFDELGIGAPDHALGVGAGTPLQQMAAMTTGLEALLTHARPDVLLVYGDTTTTLAGALTAAKLGIPLAHIEAGLRAFDRSMPEEQNRVVTDHLADLLFCPTDAAVANLAREGITAGVHRVGDVMFDAALMFADLARTRPGPEQHGLEPGGYVLMTVHRAAATDTDAALRALVDVLAAIEEPGIFPVHPRTRVKLTQAGLWERACTAGGVRLVDPVGYLDFARLLADARVLVTDSGGVQKEAFFQGVPCITLRDTTEWVETVAHGFNVLVGMNPDRVRDALRTATLPCVRPDLYGDGRSAQQIAGILAAAFA